MNDLVIENNLNSSLDKIGSGLTLLRELSSEANTALDKFKEIESGRQRIETLKLEIQRDLYLVDKQFDAYIANIESDLARHKINVSVSVESLREKEKHIDRFMDYVDKLDPKENKDIINNLLSLINKLSEETTMLLFKIL